MDVLNRLKSTVISNISGAILGNPVLRDYELGGYCGSYGPCLLWKIYAATKKTNKEEASVFVLEKKHLDRFGKGNKEHIINHLRNGISQLTRLRHPAFLTIQHPLEESRDSLAFATEPVFGTLANTFASKSDKSSSLSDTDVHEVEVKCGLLQLSEGLAFLHHTVHMVHLNICLESIVINKAGVWKLGGMEFACSASSGSGDTYVYPSLSMQTHESAECLRPNYDFTAPELVEGQNSTPAADMFSLGLVFYASFNEGSVIFPTDGLYANLKANISKYKSLDTYKLRNVPENARDYIKLLVNYSPEVRPNAFEFTKIPYLEDVAVTTLRYLDSSFQCEKVERSKAYKSLPDVISKLPKRVNLHRVLPCLAKEFVHPEMVPFVLPNVFMIANQATNDEFASHILPTITPIFQMREPIQVVAIMIQNLELLLNKSSSDAIKNHALPMIYGALECNSSAVQELCLTSLPTVGRLIEYSSMKNALLPRLKNLCLNTKELSVRVNCLVCLGKLLDYMDKWLIVDEILPLLAKIESRDPAVIMAMLGICRQAMSNTKLGVTKEVMATKIIPFLMPLTVESSLTVSQFTSLISLIKEMVSVIEDEQCEKLRQLGAIKDMEGQGNCLPSTDSTIKSLAEKQRMANEISAQEKLRAQAPLEPLSVTPRTEAHVPPTTKSIADYNISLDPLSSDSGSGVRSSLASVPNYSAPFNSFPSYNGVPSTTLNSGYNPMNIGPVANPASALVPAYNPMNTGPVANPASALVPAYNPMSNTTNLQYQPMGAYGNSAPMTARMPGYGSQQQFMGTGMQRPPQMMNNGTGSRDMTCRLLGEFGNLSKPSPAPQPRPVQPATVTNAVNAQPSAAAAGPKGAKDELDELFG